MQILEGVHQRPRNTRRLAPDSGQQQPARAAGSTTGSFFRAGLAGLHGLDDRTVSCRRLAELTVIFFAGVEVTGTSFSRPARPT